MECDLCDYCHPVDIVKLSLVVKVVPIDETTGKRSKNKSMYLATLGITNLRAKGSRTTNLGIEFTYNVYALVQDPQSVSRMPCMQAEQTFYRITHLFWSQQGEQGWVRQEQGEGEESQQHHQG